MALMTLQTTALGTFTFAHNPADVRRISKPRSFKNRDTIESNVIFDWGFKSESSGLEGTRWILKWPYMKRVEWQNFRNYYESLETVTWNPTDRAMVGGQKHTILFRGIECDDLFVTTSYMQDVSVEFEITGTTP